MKSRRVNQKNFSVMLPKERADALESKLKEQGKTKKAWLDEKIDEELGK